MEKIEQNWNPSPSEYLAHVSQSAETALEYQPPRPIVLQDVIMVAKKNTGHDNEEEALRQVYLEERMSDIWQGYIYKSRTPQELTTLIQAMGEWAPTIAMGVQHHNRGAPISALTKQLLAVSGRFVITNPDSLPELGEAWASFAPKKRRKNGGISESIHKAIHDMDFLEIVSDRLLLNKPIQNSNMQPGALSLAASKVMCFALERATNDPKRNTKNAQRILDFITTDQNNDAPMFSFGKIVAVANTIIEQKNAQLPPDAQLPKLRNEIDNYPMAFALTLEATRARQDQRQAIDDEICITTALELLSLANKQADLIPRTFGVLAIMYPDATEGELAALLKEDAITSRSKAARLYRIARSQANKERQIGWRAKTKTQGGLLT